MAAVGGRMGREALAGLLIAAAVWLAWLAARPALDHLLPPSLALRFDPGSPDLLATAAEGELAAGRADKAAKLARASLAKAPFNVRALRLLGLVSARRGDEARADDLLTQAGNWSLRDDPAHAWLVARRLSQGQFDSAVAHADLLARRRVDLYPQVFPVFDVMLADPRTALLVAARVAADPPWRYGYLMHLVERSRDPTGAAHLAIAMRQRDTPLANGELGAVYERLAADEQFDALRALRRQMGGPALSLLADGAMPGEPGPGPFTWSLDGHPGMNLQILPDPEGDAGDTAMRMESDGFTPGIATSQLLLLAPGTYRLTGAVRWETPPPAGPPAWRIICRGSGTTLGQVAPAGRAGGRRRFEMTFVAPATGCAAQELRLVAPAGDRRVDAVVWYDDLELRKVV